MTHLQRLSSSIAVNFIISYISVNRELKQECGLVLLSELYEDMTFRQWNMLLKVSYEVFFFSFFFLGGCAVICLEWVRTVLPGGRTMDSLTF